MQSPLIFFCRRRECGIKVRLACPMRRTTLTRAEIGLATKRDIPTSGRGERRRGAAGGRWGAGRARRVCLRARPRLPSRDRSATTTSPRAPMRTHRSCPTFIPTCCEDNFSRLNKTIVLFTGYNYLQLTSETLVYLTAADVVQSLRSYILKVFEFRQIRLNNNFQFVNFFKIL